MGKISTISEIKAAKESILSAISSGASGDGVIHVRVAMATCGIASGARNVMEVIINECNRRNIPVEVTQTGCMGYCYAEPTVEVTKPGQAPVVFGFITPLKAEELVAKYFAGNEMLDGVIPVNYEKVEL